MVETGIEDCVVTRSGYPDVTPVGSNPTAGFLQGETHGTPPKL